MIIVLSFMMLFVERKERHLASYVNHEVEHDELMMQGSRSEALH